MERLWKNREWMGMAGHGIVRRSVLADGLEKKDKKRQRANGRIREDGRKGKKITCELSSHPLGRVPVPAADSHVDILRGIPSGGDGHGKIHGLRVHGIHDAQ